MSAKKIEKMLAAAGVPEGAKPPYMTTARGMFAAIAWKAIHDIPEGDLADELVQNAHRFAKNFWNGFHGLQNVMSHPIIGQHSVATNEAGMLQPKHGMAFVGGAIYLPSIRTNTPARHVVERDVPTIAAVADVLATRVIATLREEIPRVTIRRADKGRFTRWSGMAVEVVLEGHAWKAASWTSLEMLNKSMDDLMHKVGYAPPRVADAIRRRDALLRRNPAIAAAMAEIAERSMLPIHLSRADAIRRRDTLLRRNPEITITMADIAESTMLPIRLTAAPSPQQGHDGGHDAMLMLEGYGPGGEPAIQKIGGISEAKGIERWTHEIDKAVATQRRLHEQYGPAPSSQRGEWQIDLVSARMLLEAPDGAEILARAITAGRATTVTDLELRVCSRQPHRILGRGAITATASWHGDEIRIVGQQLPETVMATLIGKPIDAIVDSPLLKDAGTITSVHVNTLRRQPRINIRVRPTMRPLNLGGKIDNV